jgi:hypothetical protein
VAQGVGPEFKPTLKKNYNVHILKYLVAFKCIKYKNGSEI